MNAIQKVLSIARMECRFSLRRGGPVVVMSLVGVICISGILIGPIYMLIVKMHPDSQRLAEMGLTLESYLQLMRELVSDTSVAYTVMAWFLFTGLVSFLLVLVTASTIPSDRDFGVHELLRSMPITGSIYLAGKIIGVIITVLVIGLMFLVLGLVVFNLVMLSFLRLNMPGYLIGFYLRLSLLDGVPLLIWASTIGVLTGTAMRSRKSATILGIFAGGLSLFGWVVLFKPPQIENAGILDKAFIYCMQFYNIVKSTSASSLLGLASPPNLFQAGGGEKIIALVDLAGMYVTVFIVLLIIGILCRLLLRVKDNF